MLRQKLDPSVVSLREIARFSRCLKFFIDYYKKKNYFERQKGNEKLEKIKSIIISIYICYYIRLTIKQAREEFDINLMKEFIILIINNNKDSNNNETDLLSKISNKEFIDDIKHRTKYPNLNILVKYLK